MTAIDVHELGKIYLRGKSIQGDLRGHIRLKITQWWNRKNLPEEKFWALQHVSFKVNEGETLGIIGPNGSGKSTLLKILSRITTPTCGTAKLRGRVSSLLEVGTGFHPELTGRENIFLNGAILGMKRMEIKRQLEEIIDFSGVEKFIDTPVKHYSSGMYLRLAFSVTAHLDADILLIDEILAVGDVTYRKKCIDKIDKLSSHEGKTILLVSHNMENIASICSKGMLLDGGKFVKFGDVEEVLMTYINIEKSNLNIPIKLMCAKGGSALMINRIDLLISGQLTSSIPSGNDFVLDIYYKANSSLRSVLFKLDIYNYMQLKVATINSRISNYEFRDIKSEGVARCHIRNIPLNTGDFNVTITVKDMNRTIFEFNNAFVLKIIDGVFYKTLLLPDPKSAVLLDYNWEMV